MRHLLAPRTTSLRHLLSRARAASMRHLQSLAPPAPLLADSDMQALVEHVWQASRLLCITGAGISTHSGIPDYRSPLGSYSRGHKPMQHREFMGSSANRQRYWARSFVGWQYFSRAQPNAAHVALASLEAAGWLEGGLEGHLCRRADITRGRPRFTRTQTDRASLVVPVAASLHIAAARLSAPQPLSHAALEAGA